MTNRRTASGLDGVVACETQLSEVDGEAGRLLLRGYPVDALSGHRRFEEVATLFWDGTLSGAAAGALGAELGEARVRAYEAIVEIGDALEAADGMDALRAAVAHGRARGDDLRAQAVDLTAAVAVYGAAWVRRHRGQPITPPRADRSHTEDYLTMVHGAAPPQAWVDALDAYLVAVVDHGMNASTFAARVVASTESDPVSAVVAAIGALKGRLHGGAPGPVLDMLDAVGSPEQAGAWLKRELDEGHRIMGMGHRVYRVRDPRAAVLERAVLRLGESGDARGRLALARAVERAAEALLAERHPDRPLRANVEFYTAVLLEALSLPRSAFTLTFAAGRVVGWTAHVMEQRATGRLIRPKSRYVGPRPNA